MKYFGPAQTSYPGYLVAMQPLNSTLKMADDGLLTVQVTVPQGRMIKSSRGDESFTSFVRIDFGSRSHCETARVVVADGTALYGDATSSFDIQASSRALLLDELSHKPLVLSLIESMPKDKKAKEEKTVVLGQSIVDLMPFLQGEKTISETVVVFPCTSQSEDKPATDLPELDVLVSLSSPLLTEEEVEAASSLSIKVNSLYSPPDGWQPGGSQYQYTLSLPIPIGISQETTIAIPNGQLKAPSDHDSPHWRWSYTGTASGPCVYKCDSVIKKVQYKEENGELRSAADIPFRVEAESQKPRITWNAERRCLLNAEASSTLQSMIAQSRVWPVEIFRTLTPQSGKTKKDEEILPSYHGVAYVNLTPLLYPGVSKVNGAYCLQPYVDTEVQEKTRRKMGSTVEVAMRSVSQAGSRSIASARKSKRQSVAVPPPKSGLATSSFVASDTGDSIPEVGESKNYLEAKAYTDARSYIVLELSLDTPLIPKCPPDELAQLVSEYIPPRPAAPKRQVGADQAVREFQTQVSNVAWCVLEEFRSMFGEQMANYELPHSAEAAADRRRQLLYELNTSGKYYQFKEQLKLSVVKLVREKFLRTTPVTDKDELHSFLSQLYVYLTDEMHCTLSTTFSLEDPRPVPPPVTNTNFLKHFAREAEMNESYEKAAQYYQERLAQDKNSRDHWYDYGRFCLVVHNYEKAQECFKEAVALDQNHMESLLMYAVVAAVQEHHDIAETFFEAAAAVEPKNVIVWTTMGLYYESIGNDVNAEMAFLEADNVNPQVIKEGSESAGISDGTRQHSELSHHSSSETEQTVAVPAIKTTSPIPQVSAEGDQEIKDFDKPHTVTLSQAKPQRQVSSQAILSRQSKTSPSSTAPQEVPSPLLVQDTHRSQASSPASSDKESIFLQVSRFLLEMHVTLWAESALSHELLQPRGGPSSPYYMALACVNMQKKNYIEAKTYLNEALSFDYHHPDSWALLGHSSYMTGDVEEAREAYERVLDFIGEACDMHTVYLRLGSIYLQEGQFTGAKHTFLLACKRSPSCITWLGAGIACYRMGDLAEAEDALCEANILNNTDPQVWGYLALICLKTGRKVEAEQAYKYAFKLNLSDDKLLNEIRTVQKQVGFGDPSVTYQSA